jgi:hypothetical protein
MTRTNDSPDLGIIAWTRNPGRLADIGRALSVEPKIIAFPRLGARWLAACRYVASVGPTLAWLVRARPRMIIVTCPPPFAAALVAVYCRLAKAAFILDAHPSAFGHRARVWGLLVPLQRALVRQARVTLVTEPTLGAVVEEWGGRYLVFHEAPPPTSPSSPPASVSARPKVVFTTIFAPDEPLGVIAAAACELHECDVAITGDAQRLASELRQRLVSQPHIRLTGWLQQADYLALILQADVVVALTVDPHSVMRSAFEAAYLERPTVLSDTATLRQSFSPSVFVQNEPDAIVRGVRDVLAEYKSWRGQMLPRHQMLARRWTSQRAALESAISDPSSTPTTPASASPSYDSL